MAHSPKTGAACHCKPGAQRDNCPDCEGSGQMIDFRAIRAATMNTSINAKPAEWSEQIRAEWVKRLPKLEPGQSVSGANYYTPRPAVDQYNRGSRYAGFTYALQPGNHICQIQWIPGK